LPRRKVCSAVSNPKFTAHSRLRLGRVSRRSSIGPHLPLLWGCALFKVAKAEAINLVGRFPCSNPGLDHRLPSPYLDLSLTRAPRQEMD